MILIIGIAVVGVVAYKMFTADQVSKAQEPRSDVYVAGGQVYEHNGITITLPAPWSGSMMSSGITNSTDSIDALILKTDIPQTSLTLYYDQNKMMDSIESLNSEPESSPRHYGRGFSRLIFSLEEQLQAERKQETGSENSFDLYASIKEQTEPLTVGGKEGRLALSDTTEEGPCLLGIFVPYGKDELLVLTADFQDPQGTEAAALYQSETFQAFLNSLTFREDTPWDAFLSFFQGD